MIDALGIFRRDPEASAAFIQITRTGDIFKILGERAVVGAARSARALALLELVTGAHHAHFALRVLQIRIIPARINGEAIGGVADVRKPGFVIGIELLQQFERDRVIMKSTGGLHVAVAEIEAEVELAGARLIMPAAVAIILPKLRCSGIKHHAVQGDAVIGSHAEHRPVRGLRVQRQFAMILLCRDGIGIPASRKMAHEVIGDAVGINDSLLALNAESNFIFSGRLNSGFVGNASR